MYLWGRDGGWIELHGFCAGWRPHDFTKDGMLYIRRCHRIFVASGEMNPGRYDMSRLRGGSTDEIILASESFLRWWIDYEKWAAQELGTAWRTEKSSAQPLGGRPRDYRVTLTTADEALFPAASKAFDCN
jgi:hypothetical protein